VISDGLSTHRCSRHDAGHAAVLDARVLVACDACSIAGSEHPTRPDSPQGPRVDDADRAEELRDADLSQREVARVLGQSRSKAQALLSQRPTSSAGRHGPIDRRMGIEAGMAYLDRYGELPTSVSWNATKAYEKSSEAWGRYAAGWASHDDPEQWRKWPHPSTVSGTFTEGMPELQREVQRKYAARAKEGDPYRAVAVPADRQALAEVKALMRSWWGPDKRDARAPADVLRIGDFDIEPAPSPAVLMPVAAVSTDFGPAAFPPCDERPTLGLMGKRGCGKTAVLWRIALNDMLDMHGKVIVLERGPGDVTEQLENALEEPIGDDLRSLGRRIGDGCFDLSPVAMVSDDASLRAQILTLIAKLARRGISGPVSLICDDGQDLLPVLLKILAPRPRDLHVTVAWTPLGTSDDVAMMQRCPYLHSFPQKHRGIATVLAEELNRRNELAE
jgi:hypothetical protein